MAATSGSLRTVMPLLYLSMMATATPYIVRARALLQLPHGESPKSVWLLSLLAFRWRSSILTDYLRHGVPSLNLVHVHLVELDLMAHFY